MGEEYYPLGHTQFGSLINKIKLKKPDVVYAIVVGGSNVSFYKQLKAAGVTADKQTLLTISVTEDEMLRHRRRERGRLLRGHEVLPEPRQRQQQEVRGGVQGEVRRQGGHRRRDPGRLSRARGCGRPRSRRPKSFDVDKVVAASPGIELKTAPEGYVKVHENHHLWSKLRIGQAQADGQFKVALRVGADRAEPVPQGLSVTAKRGSPLTADRRLSAFADSEVEHERIVFDLRSCRASTGSACSACCC